MAAKFYKCKTCEEFFYLIRHGEDKCNHKEDFLKEIIPDCTECFTGKTCSGHKAGWNPCNCFCRRNGTSYDGGALY